MLGHATRKGFGVKSKVSNRQGVSALGQPPLPHTGLLVKNIFFGYDTTKRSVVIGPVRLSGGTPESLAALEYGGTSRITTRRKGKRTVISAKIAARPYMQPALNKELPKLPAMWANSVKP